MQGALHVRTRYPLHVLPTLIRKSVAHGKDADVQKARVVLVRLPLSVLPVFVEGSFVDHMEHAVVKCPEVIHQVVMSLLRYAADDFLCATNLVW